MYYSSILLIGLSTLVFRVEYWFIPSWKIFVLTWQNSSFLSSIRMLRFLSERRAHKIINEVYFCPLCGFCLCVSSSSFSWQDYDYPGSERGKQLYGFWGIYHCSLLLGSNCKQYLLPLPEDGNCKSKHSQLFYESYIVIICTNIQCSNESQLVINAQFLQLDQEGEMVPSFTTVSSFFFYSSSLSMVLWLRHVSTPCLVILNRAERTTDTIPQLSTVKWITK